MEVATATTVASAGISLYQAGGLALLLIAMGAFGIFFMARWFMGMVRELGAELKSVRDEMQRTLVGVIKDNTASNHELKDEIRHGNEAVQQEVAKQTVIIAQQNSAMRDRPCLIETGQHRALPTPLPQLPHGRPV